QLDHRTSQLSCREPEARTISRRVWLRTSILDAEFVHRALRMLASCGMGTLVLFAIAVPVDKYRMQDRPSIVCGSIPPLHRPEGRSRGWWERPDHRLGLGGLAGVGDRAARSRNRSGLATMQSNST